MPETKKKSPWRKTIAEHLKINIIHHNFKNNIIIAKETDNVCNKNKYKLLIKALCTLGIWGKIHKLMKNAYGKNTSNDMTFSSERDWLFTNYIRNMARVFVCIPPSQCFTEARQENEIKLHRLEKEKHITFADDTML